MEPAGEVGKDVFQQDLEVSVSGAERVLQPIAPVRKKRLVVVAAVLLVLAFIGGGFFALSKFVKQKKLNSNKIATVLFSPTPATQIVSDLAHLPQFERIKDLRMDGYVSTPSKQKVLFMKQSSSGYWSKIFYYVNEDGEEDKLLTYIDLSSFVSEGKAYQYMIFPPTSKEAYRGLFKFPVTETQKSQQYFDRIYYQLKDKESYLNKGTEVVNGLESYRFEKAANHSTVWLSTQYGLITKVVGDEATRINSLPLVGGKFGSEAISAIDLVYIVNQGVPEEEVIIPKDIKVQEGMEFDVESIMKKYGLPSSTDNW